MFGCQPGRIVGMQLLDIHGARFYDVTFALDTMPQQARVSRIGVESVYGGAQPGDAVVLHLVMGQLTRVEKRESA